MRRSLGDLSVTLNGQEVLRANASQQASVPGGVVTLKAGLNPLQVRLLSRPRGESHLRVFWSLAGQVTEPLVPSVLWHDPLAADGVEQGALLRMGRELVATHHCRRCHALPVQLARTAGLPELASDTPLLAGAGDRFRAAWLRRWISDPRALRNHVTMPSVFAVHSTTRS